MSRQPVTVEDIRAAFRLEGEQVIRIRTGEVAPGSIEKLGYRRLGINHGDRPRYLLLHRVKYALAYGWLPAIVDHKNRDPSDNRLCNLRPATRTQNNANKSGVLGVKRNGPGWMAYAYKDGKQVHLGTHRCFGTAFKVAKNARREIRGEFAGSILPPKGSGSAEAPPHQQGTG